MTELSMIDTWDAALEGLADDEWRPSAAILEGSQTGVVVDSTTMRPSRFIFMREGIL